jgi:Ca2+-binding EF-hand superfamily protein
VEALHKQIIRHLFEKSDDDGGGFLDHSEIKGLAKVMGAKLTKDELKPAMRAMDEDGSGEVDFVEFYIFLRF